VGSGGCDAIVGTGVRGLAGATAAVLVLGGCASRADAADVTLCREVERVTAEFVTTVPRLADADDEATRGEARHDVHIGGSHLLVAAGGDLEGAPDPELAAIVRSAGSAGVAGPLDEYAAALLDADQACAEAGTPLAEAPVEELRSLMREGLPAPR
jgi:hypothetical protein